MPFIPDKKPASGFIPDPVQPSGGFVPDPPAEREGTLARLGKGFTREFTGESMAGPEGIKKIPIAGGVIGTMEMTEIAAAAKRLDSHDYDSWLVKPGARTRATGYQAFGGVKASREKDEKTILDFMQRETERAELGGAGMVGGALAQMPTFMAEFAMTGGLARFGSAATQKLGRKWLGRYARTAAGRTALRAAGWGGGAVTRASVGLAPRVAEETAKRRVEVNLDDTNDETPATSLLKGWGATVITAAAEQAGGDFGKILSKTRYGKVIVPKLRKAWVAATGGKGKAATFGRKMMKATGRQEIFSEIGEERLETILRGVFDIEDFGAGEDAGPWQRVKAGLIQDVENFGYEVAILGTVAAGQTGLGATMKFIDAKTLKQRERDQERKEAQEAVATMERVVDLETKYRDEGMTEENARFWAYQTVGMEVPEVVKEAAARQKEAEREAMRDEAPPVTEEVAEAEDTGELAEPQEGTVRVYRSGKLEGKLLNFGSQKAAEQAGKGDVVAGDLKINNPATLVDSGKSHDQRPVAVAEDLVAGNNDKIDKNIIPVIRHIQKKEGNEAAFDALYDMLKNKGYDGIKYTNVNEDAGSTSYVALDAEQFTPAKPKPKTTAKKVTKEVPGPTRLQYRMGHDVPKALKISNRKRKKINKELTGKASMKDMTQEEAQTVVHHFLNMANEAGMDTSRLVEGAEFKPVAFQSLTPSTYTLRRMGTHFMLKPAIEGKKKHTVEYEGLARVVDQLGARINVLGGETIKSRLAAKAKNEPTKSMRRFFKLLDSHEKPPEFLSKEETEIFTFFRELSDMMLSRQNEVRRSLGLKEITGRKAYVRHIATDVAAEIIAGRMDPPHQMEYWFQKHAAELVDNPMALPRVRDKLDDSINQDLISATKAMLWTALKEIHIDEPLKFYKQQKNLFGEQIPAEVKLFMERFVNELVMGHQTPLDKKMDKLVKESGLGKFLDKHARRWGRTIGRRPFTKTLTFMGKLQLFGLMGPFRPKQLIRNKFQATHNLMFHTPQAYLKSLVMGEDPQYESLAKRSLFLKLYGAFDDLPMKDRVKLDKLFLGAFSFTATGNAMRSHKVAYQDYLPLITDPKYKDLNGWASDRRTYNEPEGFLYPEEKQALQEEMEFSAGAAQYDYIAMSAPELFRSKSLTPMTRLQSWWMNYWFKFIREGAHRAFKGKTSTGRNLPWSRRIGAFNYLTFGGLLLHNLGYTSSFMFGTAPTAMPPLASLVLNMFRMAQNDEESPDKWERLRAKQAKREMTRALKTFVPGYMNYRDMKAILDKEKDIKSLFFYNKGIFAQKEVEDNTGATRERRKAAVTSRRNVETTRRKKPLQSRRPD